MLPLAPPNATSSPPEWNKGRNASQNPAPTILPPLNASRIKPHVPTPQPPREFVPSIPLSTAAPGNPTETVTTGDNVQPPFQSTPESRIQLFGPVGPADLQGDAPAQNADGVVQVERDNVDPRLKM